MDNSPKSPIRILHVVHSMDCGGAENMIMNYYRHINRRLIQFDFLVHSNKKGYFDNEIKNLGGHIYHIPYYNILNTVTYRNALKKFFANHSEIHIVHGHLSSCWHEYLYIAKKFGCYTVAHAHTANYNINLKNLIKNICAIKVRKIADYFFGCSRESLEYKFGKRVSNNINMSQVIPNAIELSKYWDCTNDYYSVNQEFHLSPFDILLGHVGNFTVAKNYTFIIEVFNQLVKINDNYKLMLVGDGILKSKIEKIVENNNLSNNVIFTGLRNDVDLLMQRMDCFLFPSKHEGLPVSLIEAQAARLPCFVSDSITEEVKLTNLITFISLKSNARRWAELIIKERNRNYTRIDINDLVNYDITVCAKKLQKFYLAKA